MRRRAYSVLATALALFGGVLPAIAQEATPKTSGQAELVATYTLPDIPLDQFQHAALPEHSIADDRGMFLGGIGSDLWHDPAEGVDRFWMVTDRGPNGEVEIDDEDRRTFPVPDFTPLILHVETRDGEIHVLEAIPIVNAEGAPVTGLPNLEEADEEPFDYSAAEQLAFNPDGLDVEGLARTSKGEFWLADEYRPSLVRVDAAGRVVTRYVPEGVALPGAGYPVAATLPAIFSQRKSNRGFEGLALSGDERTLYALLQSPLSNPDEDAGEASRAGRLLAIDAASGEPLAEYVYPLEAAAGFDPELDDDDQDEMKLSGIVWLDATTLLVLERTDEVARLYTVDLSAATDILGSDWDDPGTSPALESVADLAAAGVVPVAKSLALDLETLPRMPDKIEGVAMVDAATVAVINDNDFAIGEFDAAGRHIGTGVESQLLVLHTPRP